MLGNPAGPGGAVQRAGLWPLAPAPAPAPAGANFSSDGFGKYGLYSLLPGASAFGNATYSHCSIGRLTTGAAAASIQPSSATAFHATHKDSLFASGYTLGAPTPPPGSPYSPVPVAQLEFLTKGFNSNIIIQQPDFSPSATKKHHIQIQEVPTTTKTTTSSPYDAIAKCCGRPVKLCSCHLHVKTTTTPMLGGCSRTNPLEWSPVSVKKEPPATPCQVAEITTSGETPLVKLEVASPNNGNVGKEAIIAPPIVTTNGNIPVGIAVARQRIQHSEVVSSPSLPPAGLLTTVNTTHIKEVARISEIDAAGMAAASGGVSTAGGTLLHCPDERAFPGWPMGGAHAGSALAAPTLWQYPVSPMPVEPLVPMSMPMPPVGFQLVRDPNTGGLLLLPPAEQLQQTVVWPSYHQPSSHVLLPPFHPPPLHLLSSASSDYLQTSTTLHQHTQTHSTRLLAVTTDTTKRKIPMPIPTTTLIKIETDDQSKTLQAVSTIATNTPTTVYTDQNIAPLVTTHVIYQHPTNLILSSQTQETTSCRSQATSPVACLTPPPEINPEEETTVQDASNQTDAPIEEAPAEKPSIVETEQQEPEVHDFKQEDNHVQEAIPEEKPDLSGLELLSNSIEEFEKLEVAQPPVQSSETVPAQCEVVQGIAQMTLKDKEKEDLGGLDILCALAEQRILECERAERKKRKSRKHNHEEPQSKKPKPECSCSPDPSRKDDQYKTYKTKESEEEVKRFLASKSQPLCCKDDWPFMNAMELEMRMRLADLQRKYREKQRELSKLKPKKSSNNNNINATNTNSNTSATVAVSNEKKRARKKSTTPPPPHLDKIDPIKPNTKSSHELLKPPTLCPYETIPKSSPSKKRKVGRPKKLLTISGSPTLTETIFAKKPKKGSLVGYVLAAKEKLMHSSTLLRSESPPRFIDNDVKTKSKRIRPKLKAEVKVQSEDEEPEEEVEDDEFDEETTPVSESKKIDSDGGESFRDLENNNVIEEVKREEEIEENDKAVVKQEVHVEEVQEEAVCDDEEEEEDEEDKIADTRCSLTTELLAKDKLRVLTAMGGLFYAGKLHAVQPPDVYSITLDGERGNKPHIMSREEILRDAIVEVSPTSTSELTAGTRLCAYWSQQYRCLYPGSVAEPEVDADPNLDSRFVSVEFDDGDSGRIALEDIRLLPPDYPIIEYDPNPLLSLSKRRRRTSTTDDRRSVQSITPIPEAKAPAPTAALDASAERHREKKRMKKRKREKMLLREDKKRRKKHKCVDDNCKHRKHHKKRRKHKRHHHKESSHHAPVVEEREEEEEQQETIAREDDVAAVEEEEEVEVDVEAEAEEVTSNQFANPEDEVTMDDILEAAQNQNKKIRDRQESCESRSKMSAFLPARQLWGWSGKGYKRPKGKGRSRKQFFKAIQRGKEAIVVGDSAVFLSTGRPDRPYIGRIEAMWESCGTMVVKVKWFYHPEETIGCPLNLKYPGALFESPHVDENDVQTISHKCEVLPLKEYTTKLGDDPRGYETIYDNNDIYYLAGNYDPTTTTLKMEPEIPFN